jgi:4-amino-4-deoxy-L-arabinose transferase-like glycosyltransferase
VIAVGALAVRLTYVLAVARHLPLGADANWYTLESGAIASTHGYVDPVVWLTKGATVATAAHPPLYPFFLAIVTKVANADHETFRFAGIALGIVTVVLSGLLGRRLGGPRAGLVAAALVAVFPSLIAIDGALMSETVSVPLMYAGVFAAVVATARPSWWRFALIGLAFGLMALARADAIVPAVFVIGAAALAAPVGNRQRIGLVAVAVVAVAGVVGPWVLRNDARLGDATVATTSTAGTIAGENCATTYSGPLLGYWDFNCSNTDREPLESEIAWTRETQSQGIDYARAHLGRLPVVVAARELRVLGVFHPVAQIKNEAVEGRSYHWQLFAWVCWFPVLLLGAIGLTQLARRSRLSWPVVAAAVSVVVTVAVSHGNSRFRTAAEPAMLIGVATVVAGWMARLRVHADAGAQ